MSTTSPSRPPPSKPRVATPEQAAEFLQVSRSTVYEMLRLGDLCSVKVRRCRRIPWEALEDFVRSGMVKSTASPEGDGRV